jgi:hypothetical protein
MCKVISEIYSLIEKKDLRAANLFRDQISIEKYSYPYELVLKRNKKIAIAYNLKEQPGAYDQENFKISAANKKGLLFTVTRFRTPGISKDFCDKVRIKQKRIFTFRTTLCF